MGIFYEKFVVMIGKYGNMLVVSVLMVFGWVVEEEIFNVGDKIIFCSVGVGLMFVGGLFVW